MQWRRRRRVLVVVGSTHRALLLKGLQLLNDDDDHRLERAERRWLDSPKVRAIRELIQRFQDGDEEVCQDDGSDDEENRDEDHGEQRGARHWKPRPRFHQQQHHHHTGRQRSPSSQEKRTFNEDEYTRITTPRQDVLFKKGYLGRKRPTAEAGTPSTTPNGAPVANGTNGYANGSTNGDGAMPNGEGVDVECGDGSDMMDEQAYYYPGTFVDPASGMYYGGSYEMYDPYTGAVTVVVGPGPGGLVGMHPMSMPPIEWFNPRLPPPPHGPPPHMGHGPHGAAPHMQSDYCYMHGRKRYSVDSQNCSGPSSESAGSGPPSGPPSSPQDCDSGGLTSGPSPGPLPPMGHIPYPPHYVYPYMFGTPLYSLDGVSVQGGPPYGPICDVNTVNKRRKKKRRRKRRRGGGTDDGSEESSSEDKELEEGAGPSSLSSQSVDSSQASAQATPTDSDAFPEFIPKATTSTLNGNASVWEPSILTPPQTPIVQEPVSVAIPESIVQAIPEAIAEVNTEAVEQVNTEAIEVNTGAIEVNTEAVKEVNTEADEEFNTEADEEFNTETVEEVNTDSVEVIPETVADIIPQAIAEVVPVVAAETVPDTLPDTTTDLSPRDVEKRELKQRSEISAASSGEEAAPPARGRVLDTTSSALPLNDVTGQDLKATATPSSLLTDEETSSSGEAKGDQEALVLVEEVLCVSKKAANSAGLQCTLKRDVASSFKEALTLDSSVTLPQEKVPIPNGDVICFKEAVQLDSQTTRQSREISSDSGKDFSEFGRDKETLEVILNNNKNECKQKGKGNQNKNAVTDGMVEVGNKIVYSTNGKLNKIKNNKVSSPDHRESNGLSGKARLSTSPFKDVVSDAVKGGSKGESDKRPAQIKSDPVSKTKGPSAKRKAPKKGAAKTDLSSNKGGSNGVMAQSPPSSTNTPPTKKSPSQEELEDVSLSLRPETSISWGRRAEDAKVRPVDDVLLKALVGTAPETKADIPVDSELQTLAAHHQLQPEVEPQSKPSPPTSPPQPQTDAATEIGGQKNRLTPSSAAQRRPKKWRQNAKERAPTPGRELTESTSTASSSSISSDEAEEGETVIFVSPLASQASQASHTPDKAESESPLRITEAVTAWLRDHDSEDILVPPPPRLASASDDDDSESELEEDQLDETNEENTHIAGSKNAKGNPFLASSHSSTTRAGSGPGRDVGERVARLDVDDAWDTLCDPSLFVAKYYRLGDDPQDLAVPVVALELRDNVVAADKDKVALTRSSHLHPQKGWFDQHDSGVHSDESGDEHQTHSGLGQSAKTEAQQAARNAQAEEFAAKSAYLLRQLKGQSPVPCGGICCALQ